MGVWGTGGGYLFMGGLGTHAQDVLKPLVEWFYAT